MREVLKRFDLQRWPSQCVYSYLNQQDALSYKVIYIHKLTLVHEICRST